MGAWTNYAENKLIDAVFRGQSLGAPATHYFALIKASRGYSSAVRSLAVTSGDTVLPTTPNGHLYRCSTSGTCGSGEPTWPTGSGATVTDGTAVWTEMTPDFEAGTNLTEVSTSSTGYGRVGVTASLANFAGTQSAGSTSASSGTGGTTSNNSAITFGSPIADWGVLAAYVGYDASTSGNPWAYQMLDVPKTVNNADAAPAIAIAAFTFQVDN